MKVGKDIFNARLAKLKAEHGKFLAKKNKKRSSNFNGIYHRYHRPILTAAHAPLHWCYDLNYDTKSISDATYWDKRNL